MPIIDHLLGHPTLRKAVWRLWYPFLTRRLHGEGVVFLNYAYEDDPPPGIPLAPEDEPHRFCAQLYHHVGSLAELGGKRVLEVSCGHGGGASYLTRTFAPAKYIGLDLNPAAIDFCRKRHRLPGLEFVRGDAENLPFEGGAFDVVINVEASHCYPDFPRFLTEVARVLKPGGHFLYADFRFRGGVADWEKAIAECPLEIERANDIGPCVIRGLERNSASSQALLDRKLPRFLHGLGRDFAGVKGSRVYNALVEGGLSYRSYRFTKPADAGFDKVSVV
jgi:ubiquinone/menaquinone biosynthesis C-methylase UbiE